MSLTGQGLASGFTGGFKMMDDYYNRQETQKLNKQNAENNQAQFDQEKTIFDQSQKKIKVEETIKRIAAITKSGGMPSTIDTDYLQEAIGWDLYAELNPEFVKARQSILNQEFNMGSPEFLKNANLAFDSVLNKNNSQTDFTTQGRVLTGHRGIDRDFSKTPSVVKGNKILHKKLVGGVYAMGGNRIGGDVEVTYEDKEGKTRTYIAPMTEEGMTSGDGDNAVGRDSSKFLDTLKGGLMLSEGMDPVLKRIGNLMVSQGIDIPISSIDQQRLTDYSATAQYHMNIANSSLRNLFPKASGDESAALIAAFMASGGDTASMAASTGTKPPEMNKVAHDTYVSHMAKAKSLYADVDTIYKKYSHGDYKSMSDRQGFGQRFAEPTVPLEEAVANSRARWGLAQAGTDTGGENSEATGKGVAPDRLKGGYHPDGKGEGKFNLMRTFYDVGTSVPLAMALSPDYAQTVLDPTQTAPTTGGIQTQAAATATQKQAVTTALQPQQVVGGIQTPPVIAAPQTQPVIAAPQTQPVNAADVVRAELVDINAALNSTDLMDIIRDQVKNDPQHVENVEGLLSSISALPDSNESHEQWLSVYKYLEELNGVGTMDKPLEDGLFSNPSRYEKMEASDLMVWINNVIGLSGAGQLSQWVAKDPLKRNYTLDSIFEAMGSRKAPPLLMKKYQNALSKLSASK